MLSEELIIKEPLYLKDKYATKLLSDESCRDYLLKIISAALNVDYEMLKNDFQIEDIRIGSNTHTINSEADIVGKTNAFIVNVEFNYYKDKILYNKNMSYMCLLRQLHPSKERIQYKNILPINQICINNFDYFKKGKFIYRSSMMEKELNLERNNLLTIIDINLAFLSQMTYNELMEESEDSLEKLLFILICNDKKTLDKVYLGNKVMESVRAKLYDLEENLDEYLFYNAEELRKEVLYNQGKEDGFTEGIKQMAREMLKNNEPLEKISEYTKLDIQEIKAISNEESI